MRRDFSEYPFKSTFIALAAVILFSSQANSQEDLKAMATLLPATPGANLCYAKGSTANDETMSISQVWFWLRYGKHPSSTEQTDAYVSYHFRLSLKLNDGADVLRTVGECVDRDGRPWCGVECDGGGFFVDKVSGATAITMSFEGGDTRLRISEGCEGAEAIDLEIRPADQKILLERVDPSVCEKSAQ